MMVDYHKLSQLVSLITAAVSGEVSVLELINAPLAPDNAIDVVNIPFNFQ